MELNKVDRQTAIAELNKWIDIIDFEDGHIIDDSISSEESAEQKQSKVGQEMLIKQVMSGHITFDENYQLKLQLKKPVMSEDGTTVALENMVFKTRVATFEYNIAMKNIKADNADKRMIATIAVFSNTASSRIDRLSTKEIRILQVIAGYLL